MELLPWRLTVYADIQSCSAGFSAESAICKSGQMAMAVEEQKVEEHRGKGTEIGKLKKTW